MTPLAARPRTTSLRLAATSRSSPVPAPAPRRSTYPRQSRSPYPGGMGRRRGGFGGGLGGILGSIILGQMNRPRSRRTQRRSGSHGRRIARWRIARRRCAPPRWLIESIAEQRIWSIVRWIGPQPGLRPQFLIIRLAGLEPITVPTIRQTVTGFRQDGRDGRKASLSLPVIGRCLRQAVPGDGGSSTLIGSPTPRVMPRSSGPSPIGCSNCCARMNPEPERSIRPRTWPARPGTSSPPPTTM